MESSRSVFAVFRRYGLHTIRKNRSKRSLSGKHTVYS
jgi:hypothetical protein